MNLIDHHIHDFYNQSSEETRLQIGLGPLEFERNKELISRYLIRPNMAIADIGGGTGHYAKWLASLGHQVTLIDPVEKHITLAQKKAKGKGGHFISKLGEARKVPIDDQTIDLVILHGPLYHLPRQQDRINALKEAKRIMKPGATILGFAITYAASSLAALCSGAIHQKDIFEMCKNELTTGSHIPPDHIKGMLVESFFHRPAQLEEEFITAGFQKVAHLAVEGIAWTSGTYFTDWATPDKRERLLELIRLTEADVELLCISPHMMFVAKKLKD